MIEARDFVEAARAQGFCWYAGVPCSFLTPFINYVLQDPSLRYVSMANEGDAVALIAGAALAGQRGVTMMQNSGLGNAVSPLTSLTWTFRLPQLLIVTWRGEPGSTDEPQHALMGPITAAMLANMQIPWELFPSDAEQIPAALQRAVDHIENHGRPYALVMRKGSVAPHPLPGAAAPLFEPPQPRTGAVRRDPPAQRATRAQLLRRVVAATSERNTALLATTGFCGRELYAIADRANHFYMVGSMGCVLPLATGLALCRPELRVVAIDGDGAALMRMGAMATTGASAPSNLWHLLLDNGVHDSTGGQATVSPTVCFGDIAAACGYAASLETEDIESLASWLQAPPLTGPRFARLLIRPGAAHDLPRPAATPVEVKLRFMTHFSLGETRH